MHKCSHNCTKIIIDYWISLESTI